MITFKVMKNHKRIQIRLMGKFIFNILIALETR